MKHGTNRKRYPVGSMEQLNWQQFKRLLRIDARGEKEYAKRIMQSLEPARDHAALVESDKQNRFAAELWKAHAEQAVSLTDKERDILADALTDYAIRNPELKLETVALGIVRKLFRRP